jgi:hypothetical protein
MRNQEFDELERMLRKVEISNSTRTAALLAFDQELRSIGQIHH